jgi:hypothetical protein
VSLARKILPFRDPFVTQYHPIVACSRYSIRYSHFFSVPSVISTSQYQPKLSAGRRFNEPDTRTRKSRRNASECVSRSSEHAHRARASIARANVQLHTERRYAVGESDSYIRVFAFLGLASCLTRSGPRTSSICKPKETRAPQPPKPQRPGGPPFRASSNRRLSHGETCHTCHS